MLPCSIGKPHLEIQFPDLTYNEESTPCGLIKNERRIMYSTIYNKDKVKFTKLSAGLNHFYLTFNWAAFHIQHSTLDVRCSNAVTLPCSQGNRWRQKRSICFAYIKVGYRSCTTIIPALSTSFAKSPAVF